VLETRRVNVGAVAFYKKLGYAECENFGKYKGRNEAKCLTQYLN
jgi:hypothetical protein